MSTGHGVDTSSWPLLKNALGRIDYADTFSITLSEAASQEIDDLVRAMFLTAPSWVIWLLHLRNSIVRPFGLKTRLEENDSSNKGQLEPADRVALFQVFERTDTLVLLGQDDKHLNFRVSVELEQNSAERVLVITTAVRFNNLFGRLYFLPVKPFHKLIVPAMMRHGLRAWGDDA